jgi:hypothetical protein
MLLVSDRVALVSTSLPSLFVTDWSHQQGNLTAHSAGDVRLLASHRTSSIF